MTKISGDIIILQKCTKNHDQMLYCSSDIACDGCNLHFSFWAIFFPFTPLTAQKTQIEKKTWKRAWDIIISHMCTENYDCNIPMAPELWSAMDERTDGFTHGLKKWQRLVPHLKTHSIKERIFSWTKIFMGKWKLN